MDELEAEIAEKDETIASLDADIESWRPKSPTPISPASLTRRTGSTRISTSWKTARTTSTPT